MLMALVFDLICLLISIYAGMKDIFRGEKQGFFEYAKEITVSASIY